VPPGNASHPLLLKNIPKQPFIYFFNFLLIEKKGIYNRGHRKKGLVFPEEDTPGVA